jgi:hypothetical protein
MRSFRSEGWLFDRGKWQKLNDPFQVLDVAAGMGCSLSERKRRLLVCAIARLAYDWCRNPRFRDALQLAQRWAEDAVAPQGVERCRTELSRVPVPAWDREEVDPDGDPPLYQSERYRVQQDREQFGWVQLAQRCIAEDSRLRSKELFESIRPLAARLVRDLVPDPFEPPGWNADWVTPTVHAIAAQVYARNEFGAMPILADALQDAGCDDACVLNHCRTEPTHARGCWVLDAVLGKT